MKPLDWISAAAFALSVVGCASVYHGEASAPPIAAKARSAIYIIGDFGTPNSGLRTVGAAIARDIEADEREGRSQSPPFIIELGDNMYVRGLPRPGVGSGRERERLRKMARAFALCRYEGRPVPLVLVPGNHDYDEDALSAEREYGDITRWLFLEDFKVPELASWRHALGERGEESSAAELYDRVYRSPRALVDFMSPRLIAEAGPGVAVVAIDSELLQTLMDKGLDSLVDLYLYRLRSALRQIPIGTVRVVAGHHPIESYGNRPNQPGRFVLGPGWPQFPELWMKALALPPLGSLVTFGRWLVRRPQDIHSSCASEFSDRVGGLLLDEDVRLYLSGHDHNHQLIDLAAARGEAGRLLQILTGSTARANHPVSKGVGTLYYRLGRGYVRLLVCEGELIIEMKDELGQTDHRHRLSLGPPRERDP